MTQMDKPLCGFLNVLKPPGMSSAHVVGAVRRMLGGAKVGHAGTLDPLATGVVVGTIDHEGYDISSRFLKCMTRILHHTICFISEVPIPIFSFVGEAIEFDGLSSSWFGR